MNIFDFVKTIIAAISVVISLIKLIYEIVKDIKNKKKK